jgi:hypothetical protein
MIPADMAGWIFRRAIPGFSPIQHIRIHGTVLEIPPVMNSAEEFTGDFLCGIPTGMLDS